MTRNRSGWGVTLAGLLLSGGGAYAMWSGWDMILVERGWSLFIAGSGALTGGVVTMALGRVIAHLARLAPRMEPAPAEAVATKPTPMQAPMPMPMPTPTPPLVPPAPPIPAAPEAPPPAPAPAREEPTRPMIPKPDFEALLKPRDSRPAAPQVVAEPVEVDRYSAGDATYVMMSDGSVVVHGPAGVERYPSLAALRAEAEARQK